MSSKGLVGFQKEHGIGSSNRYQTGHLAQPPVGAVSNGQNGGTNANDINAAERNLDIPSNGTDGRSKDGGDGGDTDISEIVNELDLLHTADDDDSAAPPISLRERLLFPEGDEDSSASLAMTIHSLVSVTGEYIFELGLEDDGKRMNLDASEWHRARSNIITASKLANLECSVLLDHPEPKAAIPPTDPLLEASGKPAYDRGTFFLIRRKPEGAEDLIELRIAVIGNVDAGKSTLLGVLTKGGLDDGRGRARVNLFRHKHEIESGRTSSVGMEIMGFKPGGGAVIEENPKSASEPARKLAWEEICKRSAKVISFIDLAGHERYLKTTVFGMTGCAPDFCLIMVGANAGLIGMSKEHLGIALALAVPVVVCITKIDMTPPNILESTIKQLIKILKSPGCRKQPLFVEDLESVIAAAPKMVSER